MRSTPPSGNVVSGIFLKNTKLQPQIFNLVKKSKPIAKPVDSLKNVTGGGSLVGDNGLDAARKNFFSSMAEP